MAHGWTEQISWKNKAKILKKVFFFFEMYKYKMAGECRVCARFLKKNHPGILSLSNRYTHAIQIFVWNFQQFVQLHVHWESRNQIKKIETGRIGRRAKVIVLNMDRLFVDYINEPHQKQQGPS